MPDKKNAFQEIVDVLNEAVARLKEAAESLRRTAETQRQNLARLKDINEKCGEVTRSLRDQNVALKEAGRKLEATAVSPGGSGPEAVERFEAESADGSFETDPRKMN